MKVIIAGTRHYTQKKELYSVCDKLFARFENDPVTTIISGQYRKYNNSGKVVDVGADKYAADYAKDRGYELEEYPADWDSYDKKAGPIRNKEMAKRGDMLVCFWDGKSSGTRNMIKEAREHALPIYVYRYDEPKNSYSENV